MPILANTHANTAKPQSYYKYFHTILQNVGSFICELASQNTFAPIPPYRG